MAELKMPTFYASSEPGGKIIEDEVHMVRLNEKRKFDHRIKGYSGYKSNVATIQIDHGRNQFWVIDAGNVPIDDCGYMKVLITYEVDGNRRSY